MDRALVFGTKGWGFESLPGRFMPEPLPQLQPDHQHLYADPRVYDVLHAPGTRAEVSNLLRLARATLPAAPRQKLTFLEPASGSGRYLLDLARRGHAVRGLDLSDAMTAYARAAATTLALKQRTTFITADMTRFGPADFAFGKPAPAPLADVAFCTINSIRHLMTDRAMLDHLACVRACLRSGGVYIVGIETSRPELAQASEDVWVGTSRATPRMKVHQMVSFIPPELGAKGRAARVEQVISHLVISTPGQPARHTDSVYQLRTYTHQEWTAVLDRAGWDCLGIFNAEGTPRPQAILGYYLWVLRPRAV